MEQENNLNSQIKLEKNKAGGIPVPNFKIYCKHILIKIA
jgi:hypothetical protein